MSLAGEYILEHQTVTDGVLIPNSRVEVVGICLPDRRSSLWIYSLGNSTCVTQINPFAHRGIVDCSWSTCIGSKPYDRSDYTTGNSEVSGKCKVLTVRYVHICICIFDVFNLYDVVLNIHLSVGVH